MSTQDEFSELIKELNKEVDQITQRKLVARIKFTGVTPWWGGDHEGATSNTVDEDQIVGRLRWFLKAVYNRFCANVLSSFNESNEFVSSFLGGQGRKSNYVFRASSSASRRSFPNLMRYTKLVKRTDKERKRVPKWIDSLTLEIFRESDDSKYDRVVVWGTLVTLAFIGLGRGANRGFGRFLPDLNAVFPMDNELKSFVSKVASGDVDGALKEFYDIFRKTAGKCNRTNQWEESAVPLAPRVDCSGPDCVTIIDCVTNDVETLMNVIHSSFLKSTFKRKVELTEENSGLGIHTWLYGLPRSARAPNDESESNNYFSTAKIICSDKQKCPEDSVRKEKFTGYVTIKDSPKIGKQIIDKSPRRQSMFVVFPIKRGDKLKIVVLPFLSLKDHNEALKSLLHIGVHGVGSTRSDEGQAEQKQDQPDQSQGRNEIIIHVVSIEDMIQQSQTKRSDFLIGDEKEVVERMSELSTGDLASLIPNYSKMIVELLRDSCRSVSSRDSYDEGRGSTRTQRTQPKTREGR